MFRTFGIVYFAKTASLAKTFSIFTV